LHPQLLGPFHAYGACIVAGAAAGVALGVRRARGYGLQRFDVLACGLLGFAGGLVGSTLLYVLIHLRTFLDEPALLAQSGHVFYGGLAGGALAAFLYCRAYAVPLARVADAGAPALALAHAIGRIGCFLGGCCFGRETDFALAVEGRHPVQLYESAGLLALVAILIGLTSRLRSRSGALFAVYLAGYGILRLTMEPLRGDLAERGTLLRFSTSQILAALSLVVALRVTHGRRATQ
jgi:phosphatidylglycerol:prolipoprotein diacylglycerol transferase